VSRRVSPAAREARLLRETEALLLALAACLDGLVVPVYALWKRLARTEAYKRVDRLDEAEDDPIWDAAGALEMLFEKDFDLVTSYMRDDATRIAGAAAQREAEARAGLPPGPRPKPKDTDEPPAPEDGRGRDDAAPDDAGDER